MFACKNGHIDVVQLLLDHSDQNIDLNARSNNGKTALMWASFNGHEDIVKLLLEYSKVFDINIPKNFQLRIEVDKIFKSWRRKD